MKPQAPSPLILIQCITTEWTKRSRGASGATTRNRLPETLALPANRPGPPGHGNHQAADILYHHVHYDEWNNYQGPDQQLWIAQQSQFPDPTEFALYGDPRRAFGRVPLLLVCDSDTLQVELCWNRVDGAPRRYPQWELVPGYAKRETLTLHRGQWAQMRFNARSSKMGFNYATWSYIKYVLNVGYVDTFSPTLFRENAPVHQITDLAHLR